MNTTMKKASCGWWTQRTVIVDAKIDIEEVEAHFRLSLPEGPYESVGGFITHCWARYPNRRCRPGERAIL